MKQTLAFLENKQAHDEHLRQWRIFIQVLTEKKPESEMHNEWRQCLKIIGN
nr:MAG TPA: hypothetical protein [Caudoviricetes sp.]